MNCWTAPQRLTSDDVDRGDERVRRARGSRKVLPPEPPPSVNRNSGPRPSRDRPLGVELFPGAAALVVRRRRVVARAVVVHLAERWSRARGRLAPRPYHAPKESRLVGVAVQTPDGRWSPDAVRIVDLRAPSWRPTSRGLSHSRETLDGRGDCDAYRWAALEHRHPWMVGELPDGVDLRAEVRRLGLVYGYPSCCAADYAARLPDLPPSVVQTRAALGGPFVPCPRCARRVAVALDAGRPDLARCALLALVADRLYPGPLSLPSGPVDLPEPSPLAVRTRTYDPQPAAWRALVDARARRVEAAALLLHLRAAGRRGKPRSPLPRAAEAQAILRGWVDRETRVVDSLRWLLSERRPPLAKMAPQPRGGKRIW